MIARLSVSRPWPGLLLGRSCGVPNYDVPMAIPVVLDCATAVDLHHYTGRVANAQVAVELDREAFWTKLVEAVARLG